jgi:pilus assembly protein CpaF
VATSVDLVVHLATNASGHRRVREIVAVSGRVEGDVIEASEVFATRDGQLARVAGYPPHSERYEQAGLDLSELLGQGR